MNTKKSFSLYWACVLIMIQFFYFTDSNGLFDMRQGRAVFFVIAVFVSHLFYGIDRSKIPNKYFLLAIMPMIGVFKMPEFTEWHSIMQLACFTAGIVFLFQVISNDINIRTIGKVLAFSCILQSLWIFANWFDFDFIQIIAPVFKRDGVLGGLGNRGFTGGFIAMTMPFLFTKKGKWLLPIPLAAMYVIHLYGTDTPLAISLFSFSSLAIFKITKLRKNIFNQLLQFLSFFSIAWVMLLHVGMIRVIGWRKVFDLMSWWYGRGLGWIPKHFKEYIIINHQYFGELHNEYLESVVALGPFALILFYFVILAVKNPSRYLKTFWIAAMATLLYSISWHPFHLGTTSIPAILYFGILLKNKERKNV